MPANFHEWMGIAAGIVSLAAFIPYIVSAVKGKTKPKRATWWIWTAVGVLLASSYHYSGATDTIWVPVSYVLGPFLTALISIKYGEGGWNKRDQRCIVGAGIAALLWWVTDSPVIGLTTGLLADLFGAYPTIEGSYFEPEKEDRVAWALMWIGIVMNVLAVKEWTYAVAAHPIYMLITGTIITGLVFRPVFQKRRKSPGLL